MNKQDFTKKLESSYGSYKLGMKEAIHSRLKNCTSTNLIKLYDKIIDEYSGFKPPDWKEIFIISKKCSICINKITKSISIFVCNNCGKEQLINDAMIPTCPKCKKYDDYVSKIIYADDPNFDSYCKLYEKAAEKEKSNVNKIRTERFKLDFDKMRMNDENR